MYKKVLKIERKNKKKKRKYKKKIKYIVICISNIDIKII